MIAAKVRLDAWGGIASFEASGHAGHGPAGSDIVCAAFTVLARGAYEALAALPEIELAVEAPEPGSLRFASAPRGNGGSERAAGIALFLITGLSGLEREYPGELALTIER